MADGEREVLEERKPFCRISSGDAIRISSEVTTIEARGGGRNGASRCTSMTHGYGALPEENEYKRDGACVNLLTSTDRGLQTINAMPLMTAFPVAVAPADRRERAVVP